MAEYEELRLTVTLIDNASQGLATLRQNLRTLASSENREAITRMQREVDALGDRMGKVREHAQKTSAAMAGLSATVKTAITSLATAFISNFAIDSLRRFTDEMVRLDGTAKQFGVGGAQIKSLIDQMKLMGIDAGSAQQAVTGLASTLADLSRQGSQIQQELLKGAPSNPELMQAFISRITGFASKGDMASAMNEVVRGADSVFREEMERTGGNAVMAAELRNRFLSTLRLDPATMAMIKGQLREVTEAEKQEYARRSAIAQAFSKEWNEMDLKMEAFVRGLQEKLLPIILEINTAIGNMGEEWGKALGENLGRDIKKLTEEVRFIYKLATDPIGAIKDSFKKQAAQASPGMQKFLRGLGVDVETTEENRKYWEEGGEEDKLREKGGGVEWEPVQPAPPPRLPPLPPGVGGANPMLHRMSYSPGGGQPIMLPGGADAYSSGGAQAQFTRAIRLGTFDALVDFRNFLQGGGGSTGGPGPGTGVGSGSGDSPGVMKASLTTNSPTGPPSSVPPATPAPSSGGSPATPGATPPPSGGATTQTGGAVPGFGPQVNAAIERAAAEANVDRGMLNRFAAIESSGRPGVVTGSYKGLFQLSQSEFNKYGGGNILDPGDNARAAAKKLAAESKMFRDKFGRDPQGHELYLLHQQGWGGMQAHLNNPDQPAWKSMFGTGEGQRRGEAWAKKAIWGNLPPEAKKRFGSVENVTSRDFTELWRERYESKSPGQAPAGETAVASAVPLPRDRPNADIARDSLDADMGKEISSRVEANGKVTVDVGGSAGSKGEGRRRLFSKMTIQKPTQMEPADTGPPASRGGDEDGMAI